MTRAKEDTGLPLLLCTLCSGQQLGPANTHQKPLHSCTHSPGCMCAPTAQVACVHGTAQGYTWLDLKGRWRACTISIWRALSSGCPGSGG
eukprot:1152134-Pelagomonas_calceolata.AAC.1